MSIPRRAYVFVACFFSLQASTWAAISLLRVIQTPGRTDESGAAFWIAVIIVALPVFVAHWRAADRAARRDLDERSSALRRLYLVLTLAFLLIPVMANTAGLLTESLRAALGVPPTSFRFPGNPDGAPSLSELVGRNLAAIIILGSLWLYHLRALRRDRAAGADAPTLRTLDRLYVLGFAAVGSVVAVLGTIHSLRWLMQQVGHTAAGRAQPVALPDDLARILVGVPLWLACWAVAQRRFGRVRGEAAAVSPDRDERRSALRKVYLYGWVFTAAFGTVANAAGLLAGVLRRLLGLAISGDPRGPLPVIVVLPFLWAYHQRVLQRDAATDAPTGRADAVGRLYLYLVAGIGFAASFVGTAGVLRVLIRALLDPGFGPDMKSQLAWFAAANVAGLPAWVIPSRALQRRASAADDTARTERRSPIRRLYLYLFLSTSLLIVLASSTYVVYRLVATLVGANPSGDLASRLAEGFAYAAIGAGAWLLHSRLLRADESLESRVRDEYLQAMNAVLLDAGDGSFARGLIEAAGRALPVLRLQPVALTPAAAANLGSQHPPEEVLDIISRATLIIGQADLALAGGGFHDAIAASTARILLVPADRHRVLWAGVDAADSDWQIEQLLHALNRLAEGAEVEPKRPLSAGQALGIGLLALVFLLAAAAIVGFVGIDTGSLFGD